MNTQLCGHEFGEFRCCKDVGHTGVHSDYGPVRSHELSSSFVVRQWNDDGETEVPELFSEFPCDYDAGEAVRKETMDAAIADAKMKLPKGTVFEVRAKPYPVNQREMASDWGMCWYVVPKQPNGFEHLETQTEPLVEHPLREGEWIPEGGYVLLARVKVK